LKKVSGAEKGAKGDGGEPSGEAGNASGGAPNEVPPMGSVVLNSFNPVVRVAWLEPETLYVQTAFIHFYRGEAVPVVNYVRWHVVVLSAQETPVSAR
jgi:hypothetical protein